ncbi:PRKC apoptosis WT1 regulator protein isoform X1 [Sarcophilus harrisii]|uniref:Pro-apoptotic WT1 regulator n=1 Tax=Sarcophilus harrisii TaxID=9305 RepID=A0A7N4UXR9_SARHA|nr:PRKC apoptosis WT1 regulator protein isoform X1 [Sarcophilus harrisii]XP_031795359.1 PRKC apoptosis WT1 regulator protein isoform X1 [Sarcophilus harrisii]XP_031795360.1 PRKC apoptosis WT1 regulator protein isoform X1 [Sarcophilus harrisii]XP_031795361.1 PRKC apoptosis WT1 regulator protein isoform X1 [Sarcophilus harrisii]
MATGGYRTSSGGSGGGTTSTTTADFLEEWKAKREKMRAKHNPQGQIMVPSGVGGGGGGVGNEGGVSKPLAGALGAPPASASPATPANEFNNNRPPSAPAPANLAPGGVNHTLTSSVPAPARVSPDPRKTEEELPTTSAAGGAPGAPPMSHTAPSGSRASPDLGAQPSSGDREDRDNAKEKGKSSGPSARKSKGQIEKRKLREKRRSTGVVNIPATEGLDEYEDDEEGQKERKREDIITQQNTKQNEAATSDPGGSSLLQETSKSPSSRHKRLSWYFSIEEKRCANITPEDDFSSRHARTEKKGSRHSKELRTSPNLLEKKIEELEKEVVKEKQENQKLQKMIQDKEDVIGRLKEEIDLLNRDLDDTEDENEQLKQENKTLLKVVGQLTR